MSYIHDTAAGTTLTMRGTISSCGFASGDRFVVGAWSDTPLGRFADVMWTAPDGIRTLFAPTQPIADFITSIYTFDRLEVVHIQHSATPKHVTVTAGDLELALQATRARRLPVARPWWFTAAIERPIAKKLLNVQTHGTSAKGVEEWYQARALRWVNWGRAWKNDVDLGAWGPVDPPMGVGFSEPPKRPSIVDLAVRIRYPRRAPQALLDIIPDAR